jgi:hypothetical protein
MDRVNSNNDMAPLADNILLGMIFVIFIMVVFFRPVYDCVIGTNYNGKQNKMEKFTEGDDVAIDKLLNDTIYLMYFDTNEHDKNYVTIELDIINPSIKRIAELTNENVDTSILYAPNPNKENEYNPLKDKYIEVLTNHVELGLKTVDDVRGYLKKEFNTIINNKIAELSDDSSTSYLTGGVVEQSNTKKTVEQSNIGNTVLNWTSLLLIGIAVISYIWYIFRKLKPTGKLEYTLCASMFFGILIPAIYYKVR